MIAGLRQQHWLFVQSHPIQGQQPQNHGPAEVQLLLSRRPTTTTHIKG